MSSNDLHPELTQYIRSLQRMIYVVTEEEDQFIIDFHEKMKDFETQTFVYNGAFGLIPVTQLINDWQKLTHATGEATKLQFIDALTSIYKDTPKAVKDKTGKTAFYIITDPERHLSDPNVVRRVLNIAHQLRNNPSVIKILIFVGQQKFIPPKLAQYMEVVHLRGMPEEKIESVANNIAGRLGAKDATGKVIEPLDVPRTALKHMRGMTAHMIEQSIIQSVVRTKRENDPSKKNRVVPEYILEYRRRQLHKSDLVSYLDTSKFSFNNIGGLDRLKKWAGKVKAAWTERGEEFGLEIPRGVLLVGVYGCGKSLFVKALGNAWGVPVVTLSLSKLRGGLVGESESNLRRALTLIESVAPCVVMVDEAEKEFAGSGSSTNDAGVAARMLGMLSTWVQENKSKVCFAMTANGLEGFPPEILNRLDDRFFVDLPCEEDRIDILKIHLTAYKQDPSNYSLAKLAKAGANLVGREIEQAVRNAMIESFDAGKDCLDEKILEGELRRKPRIVNTMTAEITKILEWVGYDPDRDEGVRARFASDHAADRFKKVAAQ